MKPLPALQTAVLAAGFFLAACTHPAPAVTPAPTVVLSPTQVDPTAPSPTLESKPTATPTAASFSGTQVAFDRLSLVVPEGVAAGGSGTLVPEATGEAVAPWDVAPEHIQFTLDGYALGARFHQPSIYVYPVQAYVQLQERGSAAQSLEQLRAILAQSSMVNVKELPFVPFFNVPQALAAQVKVIPFQHGRGVRMVTEYAMGPAIINNNELIYHFEGLTEDEQYYVIAILPVTAPGLPEDSQPGGVVPPGGVSVPNIDDAGANWMGYFGDVRQMLQGLEPGAYNPNLDRLDALIASLAIAASD